MIGPGDAKRRSLVTLPDGKVGRLIYCPPRDGERVRTPPHAGRGAGRSRAVVLAGGRHYHVEPDRLTLAPLEHQP